MLGLAQVIKAIKDERASMKQGYLSVKENFQFNRYYEMLDGRLSDQYNYLAALKRKRIRLKHENLSNYLYEKGNHEDDRLFQKDKTLPVSHLSFKSLN